MLMTIEKEMSRLDRASAVMDVAVAAAALRLHSRVQSMRTRLRRPVNLRSRRGAGDMIWTILVVGLVAVVAAGSIYVFGPKIITMGGEAATKLSAPPW